MTVCDVWEDNVAGDIGGPCRRPSGHDGQHDPFARQEATPDLPVGAVLASALMAANYPGDSGEDVDRLIAELGKRGYRLAALVEETKR